MSALKKAFEVLKPSHHSRSRSQDRSSSAQQSDAESTSGVSKTSTGLSSLTLNGKSSRKHSPGSTPRGSIDRIRASLDTPRGSVQSTGGHRGSIDRNNHRASTDRHRPRATHSPLGLLRRKVRGSSSDSNSSTEDLPLNRDGEPVSRGQARKLERQAEREKHEREVEEHIATQQKRKVEAEAKAAAEETDEQRSKYGVLPVNNYAGAMPGDVRVDIRDLHPSMVGQVVTFRARLHNIRKLSAHLMFVELRQQTATIQGILQEHGSVSAHFLYWAEHLHLETICKIKGVIQEVKAKQGVVESTSIKNLEIHIHELYVEGKPIQSLPFTVHEAEVSKQDTQREGDNRVVISDRARQNGRIIDLRTTAAQSIFRIQSAICQAFRSHLHNQGFIEIHTPKLQAVASESGASVFKVNYFNRPAFLAQSPQLGKQMAIASDFKKVFEIGPVFRAENSNTHRHLTEFTGLDLEMAIDEHYHEVLRTLDGTFKAIFNYIYTEYREEVEIVKHHFPSEDLVWLPETPIIPFAEGIRMLNATGWLDEHGKPLPEDEDLGTRDEIQLGKVIKEQLGTDYYVLDKFPTSARPFYAMPDPYNPKVTNSFDIFVRGQEILSGGQRIHDAETLIEKMKSLKMDPSTMEEYMDGFEWAAPPHGGGGIGMERILMLILKLGDIRHATLFARDPRSLPERKAVVQLRHPESSTLHPPWSGQDRVLAKMDFQTIESLIANYGDASNTSWLEPKFEHWRDPATGAAVGFVQHEGFAMTIGDPLCHDTQYTKIVASYLRYIKKERKIKPLWLLCGGPVSEVLATKFDWRTFSVAAEQRLDPNEIKGLKDPEVQRKIRHAEKEGIKIHDIPIGEHFPDELKHQVDKRIADWLDSRKTKGKQVHLTDVHPWQDMPHRQYHYTKTKEGEIACFVILAQLAPEHGWQVKFALDFPGAPSGAIEATIIHALKALAAVGATSVTFGSGASSSFTPGHNLKGTRVKVLSKAYHAIANDLHLINKSEFREKLGAAPDPIYGKFFRTSTLTLKTSILTCFSQSATLLMASVPAASAPSSASSRTMMMTARCKRLPRTYCGAR
jgi:nondiscriminating aspartyl-tRNA synthetase